LGSEINVSEFKNILTASLLGGEKRREQIKIDKNLK
jgi:hypothetical protein